MSALRHLLPMGLMALPLLSGPVAGQSEDSEGIVRAMVPNTVRVEAGGRTGFGFLVGLEGDRILIATAFHTLDGPSGHEPTICFALSGETCVGGSLVYIADPVGREPGLDLALVAANYPEGLAWKSDVLAPQPAPGSPVWSIGRGFDWYIPDRPGEVTRVDDATQLIHYRNLSVARGVSGAPIVTGAGLAAMHVQSQGLGGIAQGVDIRAVRRRVENFYRAQWILRPVSECSSHRRYRSQLEDRTVHVRFTTSGLEAALDAMTALACAGARVTPILASGSEEWRGTGLVYGSGNLFAARATQSLLASLGRLDTELGSPAADLEVRFR